MKEHTNKKHKVLSKISAKDSCKSGRKAEEETHKKQFQKEI